MTEWLAKGTDPQTVALAAALLCVWVAAFCASRVPARTPQLFLATSLFAFNWAILLLYYVPGPPQNEILTAFSGFTLVYVGVLLLREAQAGPEQGDELQVGWPDRIPLFVLRGTVGGFGVYLILRRVFHLDYGYGTLALAVWGTLLTVLGYFAVWAGLSALYDRGGTRTTVRLWLGALLAAYSLAEVSYTVWYASDYWPSYRRYLALQNRPGAPDFETALPFEPQPSWPARGAWEALRSAPQASAALALKAEPRVPSPPPLLEYGFATFKLLFTLAFFALIWRRPQAKAADTQASGAKVPEEGRPWRVRDVVAG